jgi:hypothetical protein
MTLLSISNIIKERGSEQTKNTWRQLKTQILSLLKSPCSVDNILIIPISTIINEYGSVHVKKTWTKLELLLISLNKNTHKVDIINNISDIIKEPGTEEENNMWTQLKKELSNPGDISNCETDQDNEEEHEEIVDNPGDISNCETDQDNEEDNEDIGDNQEIETDEGNEDIGDNQEIETDEGNEEIEDNPVETHTRKKWYGPGGMEELIFELTGCIINPRSGGINYFKDGNTILKSVDDTPYYDDNLEDPNKPKYTLHGKKGDQNENDTRNKQLLKKSKHIYLFRQTKKEYTWYGKYKIIGKESKSHIGDDNLMRNIINLTLNRCV